VGVLCGQSEHITPRFRITFRLAMATYTFFCRPSSPPAARRCIYCLHERLRAYCTHLLPTCVRILPPRLYLVIPSGRIKIRRMSRLHAAVRAVPATGVTSPHHTLPPIHTARAYYAYIFSLPTCVRDMTLTSITHAFTMQFARIATAHART